MYGTNGSNRRGGSWLARQWARRPKPLWMVALADALALALALLVFALFHHVLPHRETSVGLVSSRDSVNAVLPGADDADEQGSEGAGIALDLQAMNEDALSFSGEGDAPAAEDAAEAEAAETAAPEPEATAGASGARVGDLFEGLNGDFSATFPDKFTDGKVVKSDSGYRSANVNVTLKRFSTENVVFYAADIYVRDISCLVTAFADDTFGMGHREQVQDMCQRIGGVIAINGDYYGARPDGVVIRNGELFREESYLARDLCVLYWNGVMETYEAGRFNAEEAIANGAYQAWNFGPRLLTSEGKPRTKFHSVVVPANPRAAIGYFEPGHYCFVVVDGRSDESGGMTLQELAALMAQLGCVRAYNLDGGNSAVMAVGKRRVNDPSNGGRPISDIIAIVDK